MTYGIIYTAFGTKEYVARSLRPWIELRKQGKVKICAVSVKFAGFDGDDDGTREILGNYLTRGDIDNLITGPDHIPETMARSMAMRYLVDQGVDTIIQWDSDEIPQDGELDNIIRFVEDSPDIAWYRISYANLVFDEKTYLAEPFTPPRIHRVKYGSYRVHSFSGDNDIQYGGIITRDIQHQENFPSLTIPWLCAAPRHYTWLNNERSKMKIKYQTDRGWTCSFKWNAERDCLDWNNTYYSERGLPLPRVITVN